MLDLFGDLGGILELFIVFTSVLVSPFSEHSFLTKAIKYLFLIRTNENGLFKQKKFKKKKGRKNLRKFDDHAQ